MQRDVGRLNHKANSYLKYLQKVRVLWRGAPYFYKSRMGQITVIQVSSIYYSTNITFTSRPTQVHWPPISWRTRKYAVYQLIANINTVELISHTLLTPLDIISILKTQNENIRSSRCSCPCASPPEGGAQYKQRKMESSYLHPMLATFSKAVRFILVQSPYDLYHNGGV